MPWIRTVPAEEATAQLKQLFEEFKIERGRMFTPYEVMTNNGPGLAAVAQLNKALRFGPSERPSRPLYEALVYEAKKQGMAEREMIAAYVSALNDCTF